MSVARVLTPLRLSTDKHHSSGKRAAMNEGLATPLRSVLTCNGCSLRYNDTDKRPKFLSCFHTACMSCLSSAFSKGRVSCPTCKCVTETVNVTSLADNTQLCTILLNMSSLNLHDSSSHATTIRDTCPTHAARINFWCETCRLPLCRDCTVLAHRQSAGHKVRDHDDAMQALRNEVRQAVADARTLKQETKRLRQDHRKYLVRQLEACKSFEKQLKSEIKSIDHEKKEENKTIDKIESDLTECTTLITLQQTVERAGKIRVACAQEFTSEKSIVADKLLTLGKLNRSIDDLDVCGDSKSQDSCCLGSPMHAGDKNRRNLKGRLLRYNGRNKQPMLIPSYSLEAPPTFNVPNPKVYLDFSIEGIAQTCRVVCELRPDKAPKLCENFIRLCTGQRGFGFKNSNIFRCLPGWWIQGGDFETNDGEGGKSALDEDLISAETTDLEPRPGALEMLCVSSNKEGGLMVGSQFFIHVKKYSYTHVFGYVLDGLDLIVRLSHLGNSSELYHPSKCITIVDCGKLKV